jgi:hypothetical protein
MNKNVEMLRKIGGLGLAGVLAVGCSTAMAVDFDVTAEVQNALEVTVVDQMNLGTIFATSASTGAVGILRLSPAGGVTAVTDGTAGPAILSLGGQTPARASVAVGTDTQFTVNLPPSILTTNLASTDVAETTFVNGGLEGLAGAVELRLGGEAGNPSVARLYLGNFSVGDVTSGSITGDTSGAATNCTDATRLGAAAGDTVQCLITPTFDATAVEFAIGADIITDTTSGRGTYQEGTYTGTFEVTATY